MPRRAEIATSLALFLAVVAVFAPLGGYGFLEYDDPVYLTDNSAVTGGLTPTSVRWALTAFHAANWHPVTWLSHQLDVTLFGMNAGAHHLVSVIIHALVSALILVLIARLTGRRGVALTAATLFALHPLRVESVAWLSERKDLLAGLFCVLTLMAWLRHLRRPSPMRYLAALGLFALGLMSKPMLVTLPFLLLLADWWPLGRLRNPGAHRPGPLLLEKLPFLLLSLAASLVTLRAQGATSGGVRWEIPVVDRLANAIVAAAAYPLKAAWPSRLAIIYPFRQPIPPTELTGALLGLALVSGLCLWQRRRRPWLIFGWLWYLGMLTPVSGLVPVGWQAMADRYTYLPLIGVLLAVSWGGPRCRFTAGIPAPRLRAVLTLAAALLLALATRRQLVYWTDGVRLFGRAIEVTDGNWLARFNLGTYLLDRGRYVEAEEQLLEGLRLKADDAEGQNNLGMVRYYRRNLTGAAEAFRAAASLAPRDPRPWCNLGNVLQDQGKPREAVAAYEQALSRDPNHAPTLHNFGRLLSTLRDTPLN